MDRTSVNIAMVVDNLRLQGITTVVLNLCAALASNEVLADILCGGACDASVERSLPDGVRIIRLPNRKKDTIAYLKALRNRVSNGKYDCIHFHCNSATVLADLLSVRGMRCKVALHCHNVTCNHPLFHAVFRGLATYMINYCFACSSGAGRWMYGKKPFVVIPNCFDTHKFKFDMAKRITARSKLGIDSDTLIYGHVGVFNKQKNQSFLLKIFENLARADRKAVLLLVGNGPLKSDVLVKIPGSLSGRVIVIDPTSQIDEIYCAMDCFLFPSLFESLGLAVVEAQLSGLPCFVSSEVPDEACVSDLFYKLPQDASSQDWADEIGTHYLAQYHHPASMERNRSDIDFERYGFETLARFLSTMYTTRDATGKSESRNSLGSAGEQDA